PNITAYLISLGMAYRAKGLFEQAMSCYSRVLEIEPSSASAYFGIGNTQQSQGKLDEAAKSFAKALELNPDFIEARYNLANLQKSFGHYAEAIDNYRIAVASKPDFADAYHNMGSALHAAGKPDEALDSYQRALWRGLPETHNNIGNVYVDKGELDLALSHYRQAIAAQPDYAAAYNNMGNTLRQLGQFQEAAAAFDVAIRIAPDYAAAHLNLGHLLMDERSIDEAARHYEKAVSIAPEMAEAYFNLGIARNKQNDLPAAGACFEQAIARRPDYLDAIYNLGVVNGRLMRLAEAERCYRQVLDLDPGYVDAHINLSAILMEDGRTQEAKRHIDLAYRQKNIFEKRSSSASKTVLVLFDAGKGNINLTHLFDEKANNIIDWMIEYASDEQIGELPDYDLVFNAMGDPDVTGDTREPVSRFLDVCAKPLLNPPDKVARTARNKLPALLEGIGKLLVPPVWRFADSTGWDESVADRLPLLIRPVHTHGGVGMVLTKTPAELAQYRSEQSGPVYVSHFIDYRSADSWYRKYRMIFIDRKPYPYHLAISQNWIVHYYTAEMESSPWKLEEEKVFLQDPETVLGQDGMQAIQAIGARMDLDYAGIDFSIMPDGRILVFEANPTMLVHPENPAGPLAHKNVYVQRIFDAFEELLKRAICPLRPPSEIA
ncbi:MAG: tetratricopeptide repeat protein, partial [Sulfuricellaceae bacterium]|nr:tetratricopeptide repeat protein [Sulfuricellaceae bacterium]